MSDPYVHVAFDAQGRKRDWFCEDVLTGKVPIERVFEDDLVLAFHHPRPIAAKHVVIIPKRHVPSLLGAEARDPVLLVAMIGAVQEVAARLNRASIRYAAGDYKGAAADARHAAERAPADAAAAELLAACQARLN